MLAAICSITGSQRQPGSMRQIFSIWGRTWNDFILLCLLLPLIAPIYHFHYWLLTLCAKRGLKHSVGFAVTFMPFDLGLMALSFHLAFSEYNKI